MSAPLFTAGPWRACKDGGCSCGHVWSLPADFHLATAHQSWGDDPKFPDATMPLDQMQANARLIASAPDLYAALAAFVDGDNPDSIDTRYENARQALAKARGQA